MPAHACMAWHHCTKRRHRSMSAPGVMITFHAQQHPAHAVQRLPDVAAYVMGCMPGWMDRHAPMPWYVSTSFVQPASTYLHNRSSGHATIPLRQCIVVDMQSPVRTVLMLQVFLTPSYLGIVMEYADSGNLLQYVAARSGLVEDAARWIFQQLIVAQDYCHRRVSMGLGPKPG